MYIYVYKFMQVYNDVSSGQCIAIALFSVQLLFTSRPRMGKMFLSGVIFDMIDVKIPLCTTMMSRRASHNANRLIL